MYLIIGLKFNCVFDFWFALFGFKMFWKTAGYGGRVHVCPFRTYSLMPKTFWSWFKSHFYQHFWKIVTNIRYFYDLIIDCSERQSTAAVASYGAFINYVDQFYPIFTTYSLWVKNMDILNAICNLSRVPRGLSTDDLPNPSCQRSYWMPPYRVWVLKGNWVPPAFEGISFYQIHDSSPISFYFRSLPASLSLFYVFHSVQHKRSMSCSFLLPWSSHEVVWKSEKSEFLHSERLPIYASGTWIFFLFFDNESSVTWWFTCLT